MNEKQGAFFRPSTVTELHQFENKILSDILTVKALDVLEQDGLIDVLVTSDSRNNRDLLTPTFYTILKRSEILDGNDLVAKNFTGLMKERRHFFFKRVEFILNSLGDFLEHGEFLFKDPSMFQERSNVFQLFDYSVGFEATETAFQKTKSWCDYVASLTDIESTPIIEKLVPFFSNQSNIKILEPGGNIGLFGSYLTNKLDIDQYTVVDIPNVCKVGRHYQNQGLISKTINFLEANMFDINWEMPDKSQPSLIIFKSVLHDWPISRVEFLLNKAHTSLPIGGKLIIIERTSFSHQNIFSSTAIDITNLVFAAYYREPEEYTSIVTRMSFDMSAEIKYFDIDMKWFALCLTRMT